MPPLRMPHPALLKACIFISNDPVLFHHSFQHCVSAHRCVSAYVSTLCFSISSSSVSALCFCICDLAFVFPHLCSNILCSNISCACSITNRFPSLTTLIVCVFCVSTSAFQHLCSSICDSASVFQHLCSSICVPTSVFQHL